jgi:hypothetical protein
LGVGGQTFIDVELRVGHVAQTPPVIFVKASLQESANSGRCRGGEPSPVRRPAKNRRDRVGGRRAAERAFPSQHLVEHTAERPDVRSPIDGLTASLLGAHVRRSPEQHARSRWHDGDRRRVREAILAPAFGRVYRTHLRQSEVEHLDGPDIIGGQHGSECRQLDVGRLQIAVDDPLLVRRFERVSDLLRDRQRARQRNRSVRDALGQSRPFDELQHQRPLRRGRLQPVDRADVRMVERREELRLALEALQAVGIGGPYGRQDLDRDVTAQRRVARPVDLAHASGAECRENLVRSETRAGSQGHGVRGLNHTTTIPERSCPRTRMVTSRMESEIAKSM